MTAYQYDGDSAPTSDSRRSSASARRAQTIASSAVAATASASPATAANARRSPNVLPRQAGVAEPARARERAGPQLRVHAPGVDEVGLELQGQLAIGVAELVHALLEDRYGLLHVTAVEQRHGKLARDLDPLSHVGRRCERRPKVLLSSRLVLRHLGLPQETQHAGALPLRRRLGQRSLEIRLRHLRSAGGQRASCGLT